MRSSQHKILADYFQFYVQDEAVEGDFSQAWNEETVERMLVVVPGAVGIGTFRSYYVSATLEIHEVEPADELAGWDQVVECSFVIGSGRIVIAGCTDYFPDAARIEVTPGDYRVRVSFGAPTTVSDDGLEADDRYRIQLWPGSLIAPRVLLYRRPEQKPNPVVWNPPSGIG